MKRVFDLTISALALLVLALPLLVVGVIVRLIDGSPVLFRQARIGRSGRPFSMLKFRTMVVSTGGALVTSAGDRRITPLGAFLRKTKVDELPQLVNVFCGQMSFVGPRPEVERYVARYSAGQRQVLNFRPGITDPASLIYFDESDILARQADPEQHYVDVIMPHKIAVNLTYQREAGFFSDLRVILLTIGRIFGVRSAWLDELARRSEMTGLKLAEKNDPRDQDHELGH